MPIDPETGRYITPLEAGPKLGNLRSILKSYIHQGTLKELAGLLERVPQMDFPTSGVKGVVGRT